MSTLNLKDVYYSGHLEAKFDLEAKTLHLQSVGAVSLSRKQCVTLISFIQENVERLQAGYNVSANEMDRLPEIDICTDEVGIRTFYISVDVTMFRNDAREFVQELQQVMRRLVVMENHFEKVLS